ncbi:MAG: hypothetical protein JXA90_02690 [Planctomycetes bacterium]|nr:hypothetical protein [Planctomycetota bacterium]
MSWNRDRVVETLLRGGEIAVRSKADLRREIKADASIVTQADREVEDLMSREFEDERRGVYIIGEETVGKKGEEYIQGALRGETYVIDPIDGTIPYASGLPSWGISVGHMVESRLQDGAIYLPEMGEIVISDGPRVLEGRRLDGGWSWRDLEPAPRDERDIQLLGITQTLAKRGQVRLSNPVQVLGSAVVPLAGLVQGRFIAYLGSVHLWDAAGALPLVLRHGFSVSVRSGGNVIRFGGDVTDEVFHLAADSPRRWKFRSDLLICRADDESRMRDAFVDG